MQEHSWTQRKPPPLSVIKVVGLSAGGKSTLVAGLRRAGYDARAVSQEHSSVSELWRQFDPTAVLIYLGVTLDAQRRRRPDATWNQAVYDDERARLADARAHADLHIDTSRLDPAQVLDLALRYLRGLRLVKADQPLPPRPTTGGSKPHPR